MSAEKRNTRKIVTIVAGVLVILCLCLVLVAGIAYWQFGDQILGLLGLAPQIQAAQMMPADTPLYVGVSLNLQNQAGYQNLKTIYLDKPDVQDALDELMADLQGETSISFEEDIKPWLGTEAALALPSIANLEDIDSGQILLAVSTQDVAASEAFLQKLRDEEPENGNPFEQGEHQGVTYWFQEAEFEFDTSTYLAIFNDFVVFTNSEAALADAIDRTQSKGESLADNENFQAVMQALPSNGVFFTFFDWKAIADLALQEVPIELEPGQLSQMEALQSMGMAATLQPEGLQIDTAIRYNIEKLPESTRAAWERQSTPNEILKRIPANAIGFFNSRDLSSMWEQAREGLAANPDFEQQLADVEDEIGLNLEQDIFSWMTGEFSVVVTEAQPVDEYAPPIGGYLLIGTDDVNLAGDRMDKLIDVLSQEMFIEFESGAIDGHEMQVTIDPASESIMGGYGFWDNYFIAGYPGDALKVAFSATNDSIANSLHFKSVSDRLPKENYGYFYVDLDAVKRLVEREMSEFEREEYESNVRPFTEPLRAFGLASSRPKDDVQTATLFLLVTEQ